MTSKYPQKKPHWENTLLPFIPQHWPERGSDSYQSTFIAEVQGFPRATPSMKPNPPGPITFYTAKNTGPGTHASWKPGDRFIWQTPERPLSVITALPCSASTDALVLKKPPQKSPPSALIRLLFGSGLLKTLTPSSKAFTTLILAQPPTHCTTSDKSLPLSEPQLREAL